MHSQVVILKILLWKGKLMNLSTLWQMIECNNLHIVEEQQVVETINEQLVTNCKAIWNV
jgi:hypothetical protein